MVREKKTQAAETMKERVRGEGIVVDLMLMWRWNTILNATNSHAREIQLKVMGV